MKGLREHFSFIKEKISNRNRIIIGGINNDALFMLRIDLFGMDYKRILGFLDFTKQYRNKYYVNYPVFNVDDILDLNPDCILMTDSTSDDEAKIRKRYDKKQIPSPEVLYLFEENFLDRLRKAKPEGSQFVNFTTWLKSKYLDLRDYSYKKDIYVPNFLDKFLRYVWKKLYRNSL